MSFTTDDEVEEELKIQGNEKASTVEYPDVIFVASWLLPGMLCIEFECFDYYDNSLMVLHAF